jgi:hypothetical protein
VAKSPSRAPSHAAAAAVFIDFIECLLVIEAGIDA